MSNRDSWMAIIPRPWVKDQTHLYSRYDSIRYRRLPEQYDIFLLQMRRGVGNRDSWMSVRPRP